MGSLIDLLQNNSDPNRNLLNNASERTPEMAMHRRSRTVSQSGPELLDLRDGVGTDTLNYKLKKAELK